ncbi:hypothetical protein ACFV84_24500 [Kitasatospora sp. NPDC059811]|uniref:hypothetical protein n=1 Tax=Streptomycetaceae TaxID=2062 RepID=UPI000A464A3E|nr:hypothetical protein [Streptomyces sp. MJM8645]
MTRPELPFLGRLHAGGIVRADLAGRLAVVDRIKGAITTVSAAGVNRSWAAGRIHR